jgi:hypothetical protein
MTTEITFLKGGISMGFRCGGFGFGGGGIVVVIIIIILLLFFFTVEESEVISVS